MAQQTMRMLPDSQVMRSYLARGARLWVITRVAMCAGLMRAGTDPFHFSLAALVAVVGITVAVCFVDVRWHRESIFLANLGVSPLALGMLFLVPVVAGEIALHVVVVAIA
jgi:hypothetical protein